MAVTRPVASRKRPLWLDVIPLALIAVIPLSMVAGLLWRPEWLFGPNAALSGWFPITTAVVVLPALVVRPPGSRALRFAAPYAAVLVSAAASLLWAPDLSEGVRVVLHMGVPLLVYLASWRTDVAKVRRWGLAPLAVAAIGIIGLLFAVAWAGDFVDKSELARLMGIMTLGLVPLFVFATYGQRSTSFTLLVGSVALGIALASDARAVVVVLGLLIITAPSLDVSVSTRAAFGLGGVVLILSVASLGVMDDVFLFNRGGSLSELLGPGGTNLSGRTQIWEALLDRCGDSWLFGNGIGAANVWSFELDAYFPEPHSAYVGSFCDLGVVGSVALWSFFGAVGVRAARTVWRLRGAADSATAALQMLAALLLLGFTDIPLTASAQFLAPLFVVLAWSDATSARR